MTEMDHSCTWSNLLVLLYFIAMSKTFIVALAINFCRWNSMWYFCTHFFLLVFVLEVFWCCNREGRQAAKSKWICMLFPTAKSIGICFRGILDVHLCSKLRIRIPCSGKSMHFHAVNNLGSKSINLKSDVLDYTITISVLSDILLLHALLLYSANFFLLQ